MKPMMLVESTWKVSRKPLTRTEQKAFDDWANGEHMTDLLRDTGIVRVTRYRNKDGSGYLWIQEYESEEALEKYLVSKRREELIHETESHYPGGGANARDWSNLKPSSRLCARPPIS
jgi:hypothetical protein